MKKILFFLIIFFICCGESFSVNKLNSSSLGCNNETSKKYLQNELKIKKIEVDIDNYRGWTINSIKIITHISRFIPDKYKRRFNAKILVTYENNIQCIFNARVRHSGDEKDHITLYKNSFLQSLDVHLKNGNIRGVTKFKLFKPDVRGELEDVLILTELLRNFNYLAPRSIKVNAKINQVESAMLFQEKAAKEMLEYNKRREGPILEADERFFFKLVDKIPDNQLSNWSAGIPNLENKSVNAMLSKQTNTNIIFKSENHKLMSYEALTNLNLIYLYFSNRFQDQKNNFYFFDYNLDNNLLGFFNPENILKLDIYNLLLIATNSQHGLSVNNRKFFWNSIENYFEPINYDSNPVIDLDFSTTTTMLARLPISQELYKAFDQLEKKLHNLNLNKIHKNLVLAGSNLTKNDLSNKISKILYNLKKTKVEYLDLDDELVKHNKFELINNDILAKFNNALNEIDPNVFLVKHNLDNGQFQRCKIYLKECENYSFSKKNLATLLEGDYILNNKIYQYLGNNLDYENIINYQKYNKLKFKKTTIFYDDGIKVSWNLDKNLLDIYQNEAGSRIYIMNGELDNLTINFNGYQINESEEGSNSKILPKNYPIDIKGLTGCLSLINLKVKNISIKANNSSCEDTVNLINVEGSFDQINIKNSFSDGLDIDFSKVKIDSINIFSAKNDCVDLSFGDYKLNKLNATNCGDKGLSIGEKSFLTLNKIIINNANTGIAIKDSSDATIKYLDVKKTSKCINVYRKKQEFSGAIANLEFINCHGGKIEKQPGSLINKKNL